MAWRSGYFISLGEEEFIYLFLVEAVRSRSSPIRLINSSRIIDMATTYWVTVLTLLSLIQKLLPAVSVLTAVVWRKSAIAIVYGAHDIITSCIDL
ncbi:hypothetical protein M5K25_014845 [Dendrobium thyrsiflorum]|uniref:Uncharacterized protein n=1 Tax=Dendrobium thyrsiflorum TaxID=117978 RepID=A0ABD0UVT7_DENTH